MAFDTNLLFCFELRLSSTSLDDFFALPCLHSFAFTSAFLLFSKPATFTFLE